MLYDPSCRIVQCSRCYQFGHVAAMCPSPAVCPYCSLAHGKKQCPNRKNPAPNTNAPAAKNLTPRMTANIARDGSSRATYVQAKRKKARLFPVPVSQQSQPSVASSTPFSARQPADSRVTLEKALARPVIPGKPPGSR